MRGCLVYLCLFLSFLDDGVFGTVYNYRSCSNVTLKNGKVKRRQRGRFVKFICNPGFLLAGERYSTCIRGKWDPVPPKCVRPTCTNKVHPPPNGLIYPSHSGAALHFFCKAGYQLRGANDVYCDGWKWDNNVPTCQAINAKPKLFCDFEEEDLCGWTHDLNHDFDWRRQNYNTPSGAIGTGPSFDHTKGEDQDGYYMYIESSSRNENDTARLISPIFDKTDTETCLEFYYHMFGATTGTLRVYLKRISEEWSLQFSRIVFSKSGNQGDKWYRSYQPLGIIDEDYQIVIEGIRGPGYVSDIAIDDVIITTNCVYEDDILTTTEILYSTEVLLTVESCENRCGLKASGNETHQIPCDCDENCYTNSTCCPDYLDFCFLASTTEEFYTTTDIANEINTPKNTPLVIQTKATPRVPTTLRPTTVVKTSPVIRTTTTVRTTTTARATTIARTTTTAKTTVRTTRKPTTPTTTTTSTTRKPTTTSRPKPTNKKPIEIIPTIEVLQPPTTPKIIRKMFPNRFPTIYVRPKSNKESETNVVVEMPRKMATSPPATDDTSQEFWSNEIDDSIDANLMTKLSESNKLLSQSSPEKTEYNVLLIVISLIGVAVLTTVIVLFIVNRYRFSKRRMNSSNGDSQSDVRFLTGDEILDFSLDKDYDNL